MMESFTFGRVENQRCLERRDIAKVEAAGVESSFSLFHENEYKNSKNNKDDIIKSK